MATTFLSSNRKFLFGLIPEPDPLSIDRNFSLTVSKDDWVTATHEDGREFIVGEGPGGTYLAYERKTRPPGGFPDSTLEPGEGYLDMENPVCISIPPIAREQ